MFLRNGLVAAVAFAGLAVSAFGQDGPVKLAWTFKDPFYQEMTTTTEQTMKVMGTDVKQTQTQTFWFKWTPVKKDGDNWIIDQEIKGVKMSIDIGGNKVEYDSTKEQTGTNPLADFFKALVNSKFTLTLDKDMKVTKIDGRSQFVDNLAKANPQMKPLLDAILSEEALKQMAEPTFAAVTGKEVKKGESWNKTTTLEMGPIGSYKNEFKYTYDGKNDKDKTLDQIKVETTLTYTPPKESAAGSTLPFKIKSANLASKNPSGQILFNNDKGRIAESSSDLTLEGDLSIEISGQTTKVELKQTQKTTTKTTDEEPAALKKKT